MTEQNLDPQSQTQQQNGRTSKRAIGFTVAIIVLLLAVGVYAWFAWQGNEQPTLGPQESAENENSQATALSALENDWGQFSAGLDIQPTMGATAWYYTGVQFIFDDTFFVQFEDGHIGNIALVKYQDGGLQLLKLFENQYTLSDQEYSELLRQYGHQSYYVTSYTISIFRDGEILSFDELTKVPENIILEQ